MQRGPDATWRSLGLGTRIEFAGHVADIVGIWSKHNALVLPSRCEGLPLALVEAMLCGRPAIATNVAGHGEVIEDGVTGILAEAPTVPAVLLPWRRLGNSDLSYRTWVRLPQGVVDN